MKPLPEKTALMARALAIAQGMAGEGRASAPDQIAHFLELEGLPYRPDTPYCISGVSWCCCKALADLLGVPYTADNAVQVFQAQVRPVLAQAYFWPSASCADVVSHMQGAAGRRMAWHPADAIGDEETLPAGSIVFYTWAPGEHHAEILEEDQGDTLKTVGFNVCVGHQSGMIAEKTRKEIWPWIWGVIF